MGRQTRVRFLIFSYVIILICSFQSSYQSQTGCSIMPRVTSWLVTKAILFDLGWRESTRSEYWLDTFANATNRCSPALLPVPGLRSRWSRMFSAGVGVGFQNCWSRSLFFETAGVRIGVGFSKLLESEHLLQLPTLMFIK